jgi:hypothetical protein
MSVPADAAFRIRFVEQTEFDRMVRERTLSPGFWYFVGNTFHIAFTRDTYGTYGGLDIRELVEELLKHIELDENYLYEMITNHIVNNESIIKTLSEYLIDNSSVINQIANIILNDDSVLQLITTELQLILQQIAKSIVSINAPDGTVLAENVDGVFTLPGATNTQFGIVKGQSNNTPTTWHHVSAVNGLLSINREQLEAFVESKIKAIPGGGSGVNCNCAPEKPLWQTMATQTADGRQQTAALVAETKQNIHMFAPIVFPKKMPNKMELFDKLTFICRGGACPRPQPNTG